MVNETSQTVNEHGAENHDTNVDECHPHEEGLKLFQFHGLSFCAGLRQLGA